MAPDSTPAPAAPDFVALEAHPDYARLIAREPPSTRERAGMLKFAIFMTVFVGFSAFLTWNSRGSNGLPHPVPVLFTLGAVLLFFSSVRRQRRKLSEPVKASAAYVAELVSGGEGQGNRALLEFQDGRRHSAHIPRRLAAQMVRGDMGIAYFRGDSLMDFGKLG